MGSTRNFTCASVQDQQNNETRIMKILASEIKQNLEKDKQKKTSKVCIYPAELITQVVYLKEIQKLAFRAMNPSEADSL